MVDYPKPTSDTLGALTPFACRANFEDENKDGTTASITALVLHAKDIAVKRHRYGSSTFRYLKDGYYTEKTMQLSGVVEPAIEDGKINVKFEIPRIGDFAHTFVLKSNSYLGDYGFDRYELTGFVTSRSPKSYCESMSLRVNNTIARATGWPIDHDPYDRIPLMIRETTDFHKCFLPLIPVYGSDGVDQQTQLLVLHGFKDEELARGCVLQVNYCYLDTPARRHFAQEAGEMPMVVCNYITEKGTINFKDSHVLDFKLDGPIREANTVTGLLIHGAGNLKKVEFHINGHILATGEDSNFSWKMVGLEPPNPFPGPSEEAVILLPFSRNMWTNIEEASFVDFSRIDSLVLRCYCDDDFNGTVDLEVTALAYTTRVLHKVNTAQLLIGSS